MGKSTKKLKRLYAVDNNSRIRIWDVAVMPRADGSVAVMRSHGQYDGKMQTNTKVISKGKNIGRANETTPWEQALSEAKSMWEKQKDQGYVDYMPDPDNPPDVWLPMKAKGWNKYASRIIYPAYIQPKMNGVRIMAEITKKPKHCIMRSAGNKTYDVLEHLEKALMKMFDHPFVPDGEAYYHGWPVNKIVSYVKKRYKETLKIQFWIFDLAMRDMTFNDRFRQIQKHVPESHPLIVIAPTFLVKSVSDVDRYYERFVKQGYEGAMIRQMNGAYKFNYRSYDVLKRPEYLRQEFKIVGVKEGTGLDAGCAIFICIHKGETFDCRPQGSVATRKRYLKEFPSIKGKMLTVKFKEFTEYNTPHCPTGEVIRDYE
jgi:DNA ligase-1